MLLDVVLLSFAVMMAKEKPPITVVGDVGGRIAIIVVRSCEFHFCSVVISLKNF